MKMTIRGSAPVVQGWKRLLESLTTAADIRLNDQLLPQGTVEMSAALDEKEAVACLNVLTVLTMRSPLDEYKGKMLGHRRDCPCDNSLTCLQASHLEIVDMPKRRVAL